MPQNLCIQENICVCEEAQYRQMGASFTVPRSKSSNATLQAKAPTIVECHTKPQWTARFEASKETNKLLVIDFTATWCGPCRHMEPTIKEFAARFVDVEFVKIDVDELTDVAREYGVEAMPTFILIKNGKVIDKVVGARKEDLQKKIEKHSKY
ncbi:thioredoxin H4-like [Momordica charantia]|uniref:Thioredoxin H4-like n=1 Tax=Momordica charantia TaxID=3673 RepID=A0A6J1DAH1_MOMCH|nr:thioredoxin H4-like [Momordica charantia]